MAGSDQLLTEEQCCQMAGVTLDTIRQYRQFGLIQPIEENGQTLFRSDDIRSLFYMDSAETVDSRPAATAESSRDAVQQTAAKSPTATQTNSPEPQAESLSQTTVVASESAALAASESPSSPLMQSLHAQIETLREERDWLRTRVEKLETRFEREQMLLLSESDTIRRLIQQEPKKRSFWTFALPWFREGSGQ